MLKTSEYKRYTKTSEAAKIDVFIPEEILREASFVRGYRFECNFWYPLPDDFDGSSLSGCGQTLKPR